MAEDEPVVCDLCGQRMRLRPTGVREVSVAETAKGLSWFCPEHGERRTQY